MSKIIIKWTHLAPHHAKEKDKEPFSASPLPPPPPAPPPLPHGRIIFDTNLDGIEEGRKTINFIGRSKMKLKDIF